MMIGRRGFLGRVAAAVAAVVGVPVAERVAERVAEAAPGKMVLEPAEGADWAMGISGNNCWATVTHEFQSYQSAGAWWYADPNGTRIAATAYYEPVVTVGNLVIAPGTVLSFPNGGKITGTLEASSGTVRAHLDSAGNLTVPGSAGSTYTA